MRIALFTGALDGVDPALVEAVENLGHYCATNGIGIVYGAGRAGLMGRVADAALAAGGEVVGVIPRALVDVEMAHHGLTELHVVETMHERKALMSELSDGFVAMPGGSGTLDEIFEAWTWQQLAYHRNPVAFFNPRGYWNPLLDALDAMTKAGFVRERDRGCLIVEDNPATLFERMRSFVPVVDHCAEWAELARKERGE